MYKTIIINNPKRLDKALLLMSIITLLNSVSKRLGFSTISMPSNFSIFRFLKFAIIIGCLTTIIGCTKQLKPDKEAPPVYSVKDESQQQPVEKTDQQEAVVDDKHDCYFIFDAGSSSTRLHIYTKNGAKYKLIVGAESEALANPIRILNTDISKITNDIEHTIYDLLLTIDNSEKDWKNNCKKIISTTVYATAGMRIAEQVSRHRSNELWLLLKKQLTTKLNNIPIPVDLTNINVRTITGFEEGLYAWLAVKDQLGQDKNFGIVEMGGGSSQIAFPCPDCDNDATKTVLIDGKEEKFYSYSFLGLGQDEVYKPHSIGLPVECTFGAGKFISGWNKKKCSDGFSFDSDKGIKDPYNYNFKDPEYGIFHKPPLTKISDVKKWYLTGSFAYMGVNDIKSCCEDGNAEECKFDTEHSCFRPIFNQEYLNQLGIPLPFRAYCPDPNTVYSKKENDTKWTLGALICEETSCLKKTASKICSRWLKDHPKCD